MCSYCTIQNVTEGLSNTKQSQRSYFVNCHCHVKNVEMVNTFSLSFLTRHVSFVWQCFLSSLQQSHLLEGVSLRTCLT